MDFHLVWPVQTLVSPHADLQVRKGPPLWWRVPVLAVNIVPDDIVDDLLDGLAMLECENMNRAPKVERETCSNTL